MTATIAWSYDLLTEAEALLFRRLSVFTGSFALEVAEFLGSDESLPAEAIANALSSVVQKSLINVDHVGTSTRYHFLESIRTFALERLTAAGELNNSMRRLLEWLQQKAPALFASPPPETMVEDSLKLDNVRAVVSWAASTASNATIASAANLVISFTPTWYWHFRQAESRTLGLALLEQLDDRENPELVGRLIICMAPAATGTELLALAPRAIPLLEETGHPGSAAYLHVRIAEIECRRGNGAVAEGHLAIASSLLSTPGISRDNFGAAATSGYVHCLLKDFPSARACLQQMETPPGSVWEVDARIVLAEIEFCEGNTEKAIDLLDKSVSDVTRFANATHLEVLIFGNLARYLLSVGDEHRSEEALRTSLRLLVGARHLGFVYTALGYARYAAAFSALSGRADFAVRLLASCDAADQRNGDVLGHDALPYEMAVNAIAKQLSREQVALLRGRGAEEDIYGLLEEFLAQPAAADSARASATSSPRATFVTRSSAN
jgi:hypothetical protein